MNWSVLPRIDGSKTLSLRVSDCVRAAPALAFELEAGGGDLAFHDGRRRCDAGCSVIARDRRLG
jgi:hypothetical protein